jgi:hypothetical protein
MPEFANTLQVIVADQVRDRIADAVYNRLPLLGFWLSTNQNVETNLGEWFHIPVQIAPGQSGRWITGGETIPNVRVDNVRSMRFQLGEIAVALDFYRRELLHAANVRRGLGNLISQQVQTALLQMRQDVSNAIINGVVGYSLIDSLHTAVNNTGTYGQLSRATYPALNAYVNNAASTLTITFIKGLISQVSRQGVNPNLIVTTPELYSAFDALIEDKRTLFTTTNTVDTDYGKIGFSGFLINGTTTVIQDAAVPANNMFALYTPVFTLGFADDGFFAVSEVLESWDQLAYRLKIVCDLQFYCVNPRFNARATNVTP